MNTFKRKQRPRYDTREDWRQTADHIAVITAGREGGSVRIDPHRLESDERSELVELTRTGKQNRRWEELVERAAGKPLGSIFQKARDDAAFTSGMTELARSIRKPPRRLTLAEDGSITLRKRWCFDFVRDGILWPSHVALLTYLLACWENGALAKPSPAVRLERDGTIIVDRRKGGLLPDPNGEFVGEERLLEHLAVNKFIEITRTGRIERITPGPRLTAIQRATK